MSRTVHGKVVYGPSDLPDPDFAAVLLFALGLALVAGTLWFVVLFAVSAR